MIIPVRFLGVSVIQELLIKNINSKLKQKFVCWDYAIRSFTTKWILKIRPEKAQIDVDRDFFKWDKSYKKV